jgi:hypothetical protein
MLIGNEKSWRLMGHWHGASDDGPGGAGNKGLSSEKGPGGAANDRGRSEGL